MWERIKNLEQRLAKQQEDSDLDYKRRYEDLLNQRANQATIVPVEPTPEASAIRGTWREEGKDQVPVYDDNHGNLGGMALRMQFTPPNGPASKWWSDASLKCSTATQRPVRGSSIYLLDNAGHNSLNDAVVRQLHNRTSVMTIKSVLVKNNNLTLKPNKWNLSESDNEAVLERHSESSFSNPQHIKEIEEGIRLWANYLQRIR